VPPVPCSSAVAASLCRRVRQVRAGDPATAGPLLQLLQTCERILMVELLQLLEQLRVFFLQRLWTFEERFRDHVKEFRRTSRAVLIDERFLPAFRRLIQGLVFLHQNARPRSIVRALLEERRSVEGSILLVKLMRE